MNVSEIKCARAMAKDHMQSSYALQSATDVVLSARQDERRPSSDEADTYTLSLML